MKKSFSTLFISALLALSGLCAHAGEVTSQAIVSEVTGNPSVTVNGQSFVPKAGDKLPQGTTIETGAGGSLVIQAFNGAFANIRPNTSASLEKLSVTTTNGAVTKQTALIDLKVGTILNAIDPANHDINSYGIRTPMGVAAARGTAYGITVHADGSVQLFVTNSAVTFTNSSTGQSVTVPAGTAVAILPPNGIPASTPFSSLSTDDVKSLEKYYGKFQEVGNGTPLPPSQYVDPSLSNGNSTMQSPSQ